MKRSDLKELGEAHAFTKRAISVMGAFAREEFNLPEDFVINSRLRTAVTRSRQQKGSWGGYAWNKRQNKPAPYVQLKLRQVFYPGPWVEYDHYKNDREIGNIKDPGPKTIILALVAHEIAHTVQYAMKFAFGNKEYDDQDAKCAERGLPEFESDHGKLFQEIYRRLRRKFVNKGRQEIAVPQQKYTPQTATKAGVIGRVRITYATWCGQPVYGTFDLIKEWTPSAEGKRIAERHNTHPMMGFVTIRDHDGKRSRIRVHRNHAKQVA